MPVSGNIGPFTATNTGTAPVTATVTVTPHFANSTVTCDGPAETFTITVNPTPNVTTVSPNNYLQHNIYKHSSYKQCCRCYIQLDHRRCCRWNNRSQHQSSGSTISQILMNPGTTAGTVTYAVTPLANGCPGTPVNIVVTVNPTPNVTSTGATTICSGNCNKSCP